MDENPSQLRVICKSCGEIREPDMWTTAGPLCHKCVRAAAHVERHLTIRGIAFRQILKDTSTKTEAPVRAKESEASRRR